MRLSGVSPDPYVSDNDPPLEIVTSLCNVLIVRLLAPPLTWRLAISLSEARLTVPPAYTVKVPVTCRRTTIRETLPFRRRRPSCRRR